MMKKMITAATAVLLTAASAVGMTGNALDIGGKKDSDRYEELVNSWTGNKINLQELACYFNDLNWGNEYFKATNLWRYDIEGQPMYDRYIIEVELYDSVYLMFDNTSPTTDELKSILAEKFGVSEDIAFVTDSKWYYSNSLRFISTDHKANIQIADSFVEYLKENYNVISAHGSFDDATLILADVNWWQIGPRAELIPENVEKINADLTANGYKAYIDPETGFLSFTDDLAQREKFELFDYLKNEYGITYNVSMPASDVDSGATTVDFLKDGVKGDANLDGRTTVADAVAILQYIGNRDKYELTAQGKLNADVDGVEGITANDALTIQMWDAQGEL